MAAWLLGQSREQRSPGLVNQGRATAGKVHFMIPVRSLVDILLMCFQTGLREAWQWLCRQEEAATGLDRASSELALTARVLQGRIYQLGVSAGLSPWGPAGL